jgi:hypothetical protein
MRLDFHDVALVLPLTGRAPRLGWSNACPQSEPLGNRRGILLELLAYPSLTRRVRFGWSISSVRRRPNTCGSGGLTRGSQIDAPYDEAQMPRMSRLLVGVLLGGWTLSPALRPAGHTGPA